MSKSESKTNVPKDSKEKSESNSNKLAAVNSSIDLNSSKPISQQVGDYIASQIKKNKVREGPVKRILEQVYEKHKASLNGVSLEEFSRLFGEDFVNSINPIKQPRYISESPDAFPSTSKPRSAFAFFQEALSATPGRMDKIGTIGAERDRAILLEVANGNIDPASRATKKITMEKNGIEIELYVMQRPLAIGTGKQNTDGSRDSVIVPASPELAMQMLQYGYSLPTPAIVDAMNAQADIHLVANPLPPNHLMNGNGYVIESNRLIQNQLKSKGYNGGLAVGDKKIKVFSNEGLITGHHEYGFNHPLTGRPIQTSAAHGPPGQGITYCDYSSAFQGVHRNITINKIVRDKNGKIIKREKVRTMPYEQALNDPRYAQILNGSAREGGKPINTKIWRSMAQKYGKTGLSVPQ